MTEPNSLPEVMPLSDAAEMLGLHIVTLRRAVQAGELRASQLTRRGGWVVQADDLRAWLDAKATRPRSITPQPARTAARPQRPRKPASGSARAAVSIDPSQWAA